ncbi:alanine--tRNA ligase [Cryobacterium levicorallinum]|uniref:Alanine--tRNA ligase n=1 Tax=Cryobacterium levicorallinum TaxID=995038 RepID=A0A1I3A304_9MICO|nr:alanine--tRNA ligase [Cryobacterium levicorallinum]TFB82693.1 alanine--tRNA ligase [Cryobacterium levicorallinum]GEP26378.1 alanine--tRNA ligase [Cryobacterium levicorallinum]SFH44275.1 alanyl-tRNA synthetase [Cryobacterium levicorallinum]
MQTADIRGRWLDFFADRGHTVVPSASLVSDDPTLLFTVAGMVPFVPYLTGLVPAPYPRATSVQKCIRTNDIEEVGKTPRHGTFFQMNGNFSFGDYFKEEAIGFAWELLTTPEDQGGYGFRESDLWVTIYLDDDEAHRYWRALGVPDNRIQRLGMDSNYWSTGQPGPAGPCSEIFFDRGPAYGAEGGPATDDDRYVEIWNLVFMQYLRGEGNGKGDFQILGDLPKKNIDTGMGLERVAFLKQGVENMYEIDQVRPVLDRAAALSGRRYGADHADDVRMRIVADHVRSSLMLMSDGVMPSNEGRGYILRRLLRRSVRAMRLLGVDTVSMPELLPASRDAMSAAYPEVKSDFGRISQAAFAEEETFLRTLASGSAVLDLAVAKTKKADKTELAGPTAFLLHDTYGFPIEITLEIAEEAGLSVNRDAFDVLMTKQRTMAKADAKSKKTTLADLGVYSAFRALGETVFTGYEDLQNESSVLGLIVDGESVTSAVAGETAEVILAETALWAEAGGQVADAGLIVGPGYELKVLDVQKPVKGLISHKVLVQSGQVGVGERATSVVDENWRRGARQAHSGTHVLHAALRQVLGPNAHQSGSYNKAGFFRLDFSWNQALSPATRTEIEEISNNAIRDNLPVTTRELPIAEAKALGAMALFGEKYGDVVRVVDIGGPWSRELCAGTHVGSSAEIGMINLISEASVGSTNRRVESLVGLEAFRDLAAERMLVSQLTSSLKTPREQLPERISDLVASLKSAEKKIAAFEARALTDRVPALLATARRVGAVTIVAEDLGVLGSPDDARMLALATRERLGADAVVVAISAIAADKPVVIVATNQAARDAGHKAGALAKTVAGILGGGGGGKDDLAQGGGPNGDAIPAALQAVVAAVSR